jgi:hypothetical protein
MMNAAAVCLSISERACFSPGPSPPFGILTRQNLTSVDCPNERKTL